MRLKLGLLAAAVLTCLAHPPLARAQAEDPVPRLHQAPVARPLGARRSPRPSTSLVRPDSVFLGHSYTNHWSNANNFWNLYTGDYWPGVNDPDNTLWDWDHRTGWGPGTPANLDDSLEGWWPVRRPYYVTGGLTLPDASRPWWAIDQGNGVNYRLNASAGGTRTKGVVGAWHHDRGVNAGGGVTWTPIGGGKSAWCGLRQTGDVSHLDPVTRNPYNAAAAEFVSSSRAMPATSATTTTGTVKNFPGFMSAWDQMLYRDLAITANQPLTLSFRYRTRMSTLRDAASATATGIFYGDPLVVSTGNFISASTAGADVGGNAPIDSFMVYVGVPTDPAACTYSDGVTRPVFDPLRRWFSEVLRVFGAGNTYYELFAATGATDTLAAAPSVVVVVPPPQVNALLAAQGGGATGTARLVFRVKTNKDYADDDTGALGFTSGGWGAAQLDDVVANGVTVGSFEANETIGVPGTPNADAPIDNAASTTALTNWKSTGRPPAIYWHPRALSELRWEDLCGPPGSPHRYCNMQGVVVSAGNVDDDEGAGDRRFFPDRERFDGIVSPTIDLVTNASGTGETPNTMGITWVDSQAWNLGDDYYVLGDVYPGICQLYYTGNSWTVGAQAYPARQPNGGKCWGEIRTPTFELYDLHAFCLSFSVGLYQNSLVRCSNAGNVPDSLRLFLGKHQQCFRFGVSLGCGASDGLYFDNVTLLFSNFWAASTLGPYASWTQWWQDTFPASGVDMLPGTAAFDTTTAMVKTGNNYAPTVAVGQLRYDVPGDTTLVWAGSTSGVRLDLVFRILPGPGNYQIAAGRTFPPTASMPLLRLPTNQSDVVVPGDGSFWGQYIANPGAVGTAGGHHGGTWWDPITWNSARCDTAERNLFPTTGFSTGLGGTGGGLWASMYHESDPKFATLGTPKFRCFRMDTSLSASQVNIRCDGTVPVWLTVVPPSRTGWDGQVTTREFTKIVPDGLLTPGSHVQYFYRRSSSSNPNPYYDLLPDTTRIIPQYTGPDHGSSDAYRWMGLAVLPDRWKDIAFGGQGMACMLVVDQADSRGDERAFISIADTIGLTSVNKYGAHNGWHASGTDDLYDIPYDPESPALVHGRNQQAGTLFDLYNVRGSDTITGPTGGLGARRANHTAGTLLDGKWATTGPTENMLRTYYRMILLLTGPLDPAVGPMLNRSSDDIGMLQDFLAAPGGTPQPRGLWVSGGNFVEGAIRSAISGYPRDGFVRNLLGADLGAPAVPDQPGHEPSTVDLLSTPVLSSSIRAWGHSLSCGYIEDDVLAISGALPEAQVASWYGTSPPVPASIYKPATPERPWVSLVDGFRLGNLSTEGGVTGTMRHAYVLSVLRNTFVEPMCAFGGPGLVDAPGISPRRYLDAVALFGSPLRSGVSTLRLSLAARDRALVRLYDVSGRRVRTLADRTFEAGEHELRWDGTDDQGRRLPRGVYFAQVRYPTRGFEDARRIVLVK